VSQSLAGAHRLALGALVAGPSSCLAYAVLRLLALGEGVSPTDVLAVAHIPYFWRLALSVLQGLTVGLTVALLAPDEAISTWLRRLPIPAALTSLVSAVAMVIWP
jgi:hypothetical protein